MTIQPDIKRPAWIALLLLLAVPCGQLSRAATAHAQAGLNQITSIAVRKDAHPPRVEISLKSAASFKTAVLGNSPATGAPYRLYIDLLDTTLPAGLHKSYLLDAAGSERMRIAQNSPSATRIVFDSPIKISLSDFRIFQLTNPDRIVVVLPEAQHQSKAAAEPRPQRTAAPAPQPQPAPGCDECVIVIDPGHGGKDPGAIGHNGVKEKDVCLALALRLKEEIQKSSQCRTVLTRSGDLFLPLDERSRIANQHGADLFISLHANSHEDISLTGVETYYLNFSSDETSRKVAARENFTTADKIGDLEMILFDLTQSEKINRSSLLAGHVHNALVDGVCSRYTDIRNLGVKHAPMRVLIDPEMPCILIEAAFISNPAEATRLQDIKFQKCLAQAIYKGMHNFLAHQKKDLLR